MDLSEFYKIYDKDIDKSILSALNEDKTHSDITTNLLFGKNRALKKVQGNLVCKEDCILAGIDVFKRVFRLIDPSVQFKTHCKDGSYIKKGTSVLNIEAPINTLLIGERTSLNYLQRMSGIATLTHEFVKLLKYKNARILHTRKTTPNFRLFEVAAVKIGGGDFHRFDLSSSIMIKDNHIEAMSGIENTINLILSKRLSQKQKEKFEIEIDNLDELNYVLKKYNKNIKVIMLDNFKPTDIIKAINIIKKHKIKIEVSGGINLKNFGKLQSPGIGFYSIGMITHSYKSMDFSLDF